MRVLIDSTQLPLTRTGVGIYGERLIEQISSIARDEDEIFILVQSDDSRLRSLLASRANLLPIVIPSQIFRNRLALALYEQCVLPWMLLRRQVDVVHSLHYTFPLWSPCRRVVTLHDMTFFLWPDLHTRGRKIIFSRFIRLAMRQAEGVLFVSESTRTDAERLFGHGHNLRAVASLGIDDTSFANVPSSRIAEALSRLGIEGPYILFLGTVEPRKNIPRLVEAFHSLAKKYPRHALVIAGKLGWNYEATMNAISNSPYSGRIHRLGYVAPEDKQPLIAGCDVLAYPSLYEGFGLPVLEGMAAGVPVVTSNVSSMPEVAGSGALLVDPTSAEEIANAIDAVLSDDSCRSRLRQAGRIQAKKFTWEATARRTYAVYRELANR